MQLKIFRKKKYVIITAVVVALVAIVVLSSALRKKEGEPVQTGKAERRVILESKVSASGEIRPVKFYNLTAEVPGRVEEIYVKESDVVKKGQPLVRVDPTQSQFAVQGAEASVRVAQADVANQQVAIQQAESGINQTRAALDAAKAELARNKIELQWAKNEFGRYEQLVEKGVATKSQFDQVKSRYEQAQAVVEAQQARVKQLEVQVKDSELGVERARAAVKSSQERVAQGQAALRQESDRFGKTTRYSPIDGVVSSLPVKVGEYALAGFTTTPLLTVADMSEIIAEIKVDETDVANVQVGHKARVKVDAIGTKDEEAIEGEVIEKGASALTRSGQATAASATSSQEAKDFLVKIRLNPSPEVRDRLRPGMSATAVITTAKADNVLAVPLQAIVPRELPGGEGEPSAGSKAKKEVEGVFVVGADSRAHFRPIKTGIKGDQDIEIKEGPDTDLKEGEEIITGPYKTLRSLKDGDLVKREGRAEGGPPKS
jgi:HlyD family secretion protein